MRHITLAIAFLICTASEAQIIRAEPFYTAPEAGVTNLLLDNYPGAAVAYSLRKLDKDYTGSAIRVRRTDNTEQDIGFLASGYLDTAALKTFVGTGATDSAAIVIWYNQADSAGVFGTKNASQSTATAQPKIMLSGALIYKDGILSLDFFSNDFMDCGKINNGTKTANYSFNLLASFDVSNINHFAIASFDNTGASRRSYYALAQRSANALKAELSHGFSDGTVTQFYSARTTNNSINLSNQQLFNCYYGGGATADFYVDGSNFALTTINAYTGNSGTEYNFSIGRAGEFNGLYYDGKVSELILWSSDKESDRIGIEGNINSFYSIY